MKDTWGSFTLSSMCLSSTTLNSADYLCWRAKYKAYPGIYCFYSIIQRPGTVRLNLGIFQIPSHRFGYSLCKAPLWRGQVCVRIIKHKTLGKYLRYKGDKMPSETCNWGSKYNYEKQIKQTGQTAQRQQSNINSGETKWRESARMAGEGVGVAGGREGAVGEGRQQQRGRAGHLSGAGQIIKQWWRSKSNRKSGPKS